MKFSRKLQLKTQQMRRGAKFGLSCDDISLDVITISRWISADDAKRKREATWIIVDDVIGDVIQSQDSAAFCSCAKDSAGRLCVVISADEATVHPVATQSIQSQEDSGEAFDDPVASNSSIQS
ncbi:transparent testa 12 protein [Dorcoceras hygrometricum]|uniref:Transparent testa 12 protein n=1 Tax=Dorcoceras hygrometricum TaxID=472368 RepID=A0A2Z7BQU6_9LAMI|nr:transparent testa 12 protein [Dorcoceras hygrometricum]